MQAADLFAGEEQTSEANKCRLKLRPLLSKSSCNIPFSLGDNCQVTCTPRCCYLRGSEVACVMQVAQFSAEMERYEPAVQIYEDVAHRSMDNNLLKFSAKGYLLNAGICRLCGEL